LLKFQRNVNYAENIFIGSGLGEVVFKIKTGLQRTSRIEDFPHTIISLTGSCKNDVLLVEGKARKKHILKR
jgi:hypothetical protein